MCRAYLNGHQHASSPTPANMLGGMHFQAGQIGLDPASMSLVTQSTTQNFQGEGTVENVALFAEALQAIKNCEAVLRCCESSPACVVSCVVFVNLPHAVPEALARLKEAIASWLHATAYADNAISFIVVPDLPRGAAIEILRRC